MLIDIELIVMSYITTIITEYSIFGKTYKQITSINKLKCRELIWYENGSHEEILYLHGKNTANVGYGMQIIVYINTLCI